MGRVNGRWAWAVYGCVLGWVLLVTGAGCRLVRTTVEAPAKAITAVVPTKKETGLETAELQQRVMRVADDFCTSVAAAIDRYGETVGTRAARVEGLKWKLGSVSLAVSIASGPNPWEGLVDLTSFVAVSRCVVEESARGGEREAALSPWREELRRQETNVWRLAEEALQPERSAALREMLDGWCARHRGADLSLFSRPNEILGVVKDGTGRGEDRAGFLESLGVDPFGGLDPAVREVTATRLFAERVLFTAQRMPFLMRWQAELLYETLAGEAETQGMLAAVTRVAESAERASRVAAELPDRVSQERERVMADLEAQEGKLRALAAEVRQTLEAGERMSVALNTTLVTFDALMKRFGVGEPPRGGEKTGDGAPFRILDYAETAEAVAAMAKSLDQVLKDAGGALDSPAWSRRMQDLEGMSKSARADAEAVVDRITWRIVLIIGAILVAAVGYRWATVRRGMT